jgi:hypothetical protein
VAVAHSAAAATAAAYGQAKPCTQILLLHAARSSLEKLCAN